MALVLFRLSDSRFNATSATVRRSGCRLTRFPLGEFTRCGNWGGAVTEDGLNTERVTDKGQIQFRK